VANASAEDGVNPAFRESGTGQTTVRASSVPVLVGGRDVDVSGDEVIVQGGSADGAYAAIAGTNSVHIKTDGTTLKLIPGTGLDADALILAFSGSVVIEGACEGCDDIFVSPVGNGMTQSGVFRGSLNLDAATDALLAMNEMLEDERDKDTEKKTEEEGSLCN
jgi:hypothetical protein